MTWTNEPRSEGAGALTYFQAGQGAPLVLIHGVGLRAEAWNALLPTLAAEFRVICVDMPGHGMAPLGRSRSLADFVERFGHFLTALDEPCCLAGHSMGALLAVELARKLPNSVASIAALNSVYRRTPDAAAAVRARAQGLAEEGTPDPAPTLARWFGPPPHAAHAEAAAACRRWLTDGDAAGYAAAYCIFAAEDGPSDTTLDRLCSPALFLTGADDPNSTPTMSEALATRVASGQWASIEDAAHMAPMTHPAAVARNLLGHFKMTANPPS